MLPIVRNADARFNAKAGRLFIAALFALLIGAATFARAEALRPPTATEAAARPPQVTESKATTATTTVTRAPSPSDELNTLLMHDTFLIVGPTKVPN